MGLRGYQRRICDEVMHELSVYTMPFVVDCFQSSGKSWMIAEIAKNVGKCLILCMSKELVEQDRDKLRAVGADATIYSASCNEKVISNITVATIGSIYKHPEFCRHFELVIIDECDAVPIEKKDSMYMKFLSRIPAKVIGWTGTAFRTAYSYARLKNGDVIQNTVIRPLDDFKFWGFIIPGIDYHELLKEKAVSPIDYYVEDTDLSMLKVNSTGMDYTERSLVQYGENVRKRLCEVVCGALENWSCKRILVAVPNIDEAKFITDALKFYYGVEAETVHSEMKKKERTRIIDDFKAGKIKVVVQVLVLNVGFDLPALDCVVFARPSRSLRIWCQFIARGIRLDPDEPNKVCKAIDMGGMLKLFGRIEDVSVVGGEVRGQHGIISNKILGQTNITEMKRRFC